MITTKKLATIPVALSLCASLALPSFAGHPHHWIQRHPMMASIGAAVATHHALKVAAHNREMHHQHLNWAERHPSVSAFGVGAFTHHEIKKHTAR